MWNFTKSRTKKCEISQKVELKSVAGIKMRRVALPFVARGDYGLGLLPFQGAGRCGGATQGVALGYGLAGLSARSGVMYSAGDFRLGRIPLEYLPTHIESLRDCRAPPRRGQLTF